MAPPTESGYMLRSNDAIQWLIDDQPTVANVYRAIRAAACAMVGAGLANHPDLEVRAVGNVLIRTAETERKAILDDDFDLSTQVIEAVGQLMAYATHPIGSRPAPKSNEEVHAALLYMDRHLRQRGARGDDALQQLARGDI